MNINSTQQKQKSSSFIKIGYNPIVLFSILLIISNNLFAATYYSQATTAFSTLTNWNSNSGGGGSNPIAGDLTSGAHTFIVKNGHTVTVDQDINIAALTVGEGAAATLTIGNSTTARNIVIAGNLTSGTGATIQVGAFDAIHSLTVGGNISNTTTGIINLFTSATRACNTVMNGASFPQVSGGAGLITFNNFTINGGAGGADLSKTITVRGNFLIDNNTPVTTAFGHTIHGNFTVTNGSTFTPSAGTMSFLGATQAIDVNNATFVAITFTTAGTKTITGNITATGLVTVNTGVIINDGGGTHTLSGGLTINSTADINFSGVVNFAGNLTTTYNFPAVTDMGTASWVFTGNVNLALAGGATAARFDFNNDLTINAGTTNIINNTAINNPGGAAAFALNGTSVLQVSGLLSGTTNFPSNFLTYTFATGSTTRYNLAGAQVIRAGADITYGVLDIRNNTKTVNGSPLNIAGNLLLNTITADFSGVDVNLDGVITNTGNSILTNNQTFTFNTADANVTIIPNTASGSYTFNNLIITQDAATASRTKTIANNITVDGNFTVTNNGGSASILSTISIAAYTILDGSPSGTLSLGSNVYYTHNGTGAEFQNTLNNFTTINFDNTSGNASTVCFCNTTNATVQTIPYQNTSGPISYANIDLNGGAPSNTKTAAGPLDINGRIQRIGNTPIFNDGDFNHTVAGDWNLSTAYYTTPGANATITFDGTTTQLIGAGGANYQFRNLVIANSSDVVSFNANDNQTVTILGNLTINSGADLDANNKNIAIERNWQQLGTGIFTQTQTRTTTFNGTAINQTIDIATPATSYFGNLTITKNTTASALPQTLTAITNFVVSGNFVLTADRAIFDATNRTITIGGTWTQNATTSFTSTGSTIVFNGSTAQGINNQAGLNFNNISFSGAGVKTFNNAGITVNGNFDFTGATVAWGGATTLTLNGDWINTGGTGVFTPSTGTVLLNGGAQSVGISTFYNLTCGGVAASTKTLAGNISLNLDLTINANITLDVSASNYSIDVTRNWVNNGSFDPRNGTVTFVGASASAITSGTGAGPAAGKNFYNFRLNKSAVGTAATFAAGSDLVATNNVTNTLGTITMNTSSDIYVGNEFTNSGIVNLSNNACVLNLTAASGTKTFDPGTNGSNVYRAINLTAAATYTLANNLTVTNGQALTLSGDAVFKLNGKTLSFTGGGAVTVINVGAGTLDVDAGATLQLANTNVITANNASSVLKFVGSSGSSALITTNGTSTQGYRINQSAGVFHAKYCVFSNLVSTGITLSGTATFDATNNLSDVTFTGPGTGCTQYLDVSGINLTSINSLTNCTNVIFNSGPTKNVKCNPSASAGTITFENSSGPLVGTFYENDAAANINWLFTGIFWDGQAGDNDWFNDLNWTTNSKPIATDIVYLDHTDVTFIPLGTSYTVNIAATGAVAKSIIINQGAGAAIRLNFSGTGVLDVTDNIDIFAGNTLAMSASTNTINIGGSWSNSGTFTATDGTVNFNGTSGTKIITPGGSAFYNLNVNGAGATYQLAAATTINNDLNLSDGTLDVNTGNFGITINGNWNVSGTGVFNPRAGTVTFAKAGAGTQTINNGYFFNVTASNATAATTAVKQLLTSSTFLGSVTLAAGGGNVELQGGAFDHYVTGNWTNNNTTSSYNKGTGTVYFNGTTGTQTIGGTASTTFNNVTMSGAALKTISVALGIDGDWTVSSGCGTVTLNSGSTITNAGGSSTFSILGATQLSVLGTGVAFPNQFETVTLAPTSTVLYQANGAQSIYGATYGILTLRAAVNGNATTKTALNNINVAGAALNIGGAGADNAVTLDMNNFNLTLAGNLVQQTGAPQITWGTGTMIHNGAAWTIDQDITGFYNLTLSGSGAKTMSASLAIANNLTVQSGATFVMGTNSITGSGGIFTLDNGSALTCAKTATVAFPTGFATYNLDAASTVTLNGNAAGQTVQCREGGIDIIYGNLALSPSAGATLTLNNNLDVNGNFSMNANATLADANYNLNFAGATTDIRTYTQSAATTITLDGVTQSIYNGINGSTLAIRNITFGGTPGSTKTIGQTAGVNNTVNLTGTVIINANITFFSQRNINYSGTSWTNNGTLNLTGGTFNFNGVAQQDVNPGATNLYNAVLFTNINNPGVVFASNGIRAAGTFSLSTNARVDMGGNPTGATLTHTLAAAITNAGYWTTSNSHFVINGGNITIPVNDAVTPGTSFTSRNVTIGGTLTKTLGGNWNIENLTIGTGVALTTSASNFSVNATGSWSNSGTFTANTSTVTFNGSTAINPSVTIASGGSNFFAVNFSPSTAVSYSLTSATTSITSDMTIGSNATLNLNSNTLNLGRNANVVKNYTVNGTLYVNENSRLQFDNRGGAAGASQCRMTVTGAGALLKLVGTNSANVATISRVAAGTPAGFETRITVTSNAAIQANYYLIEYMEDAGLQVTSTAATMHATDNFSNGTFQNMNTAGAGAKYFLQCDAPASAGTIANVNFNYPATPTVSTHFNVRRTVAATGVMTFTDVVSGNLGGSTYESDPSALIDWPLVTAQTWTGASLVDNRNWNDPDNWSPTGIPTNNSDVTIPSAGTNPLIDATSGTAVCKNLTITTGRLDLAGGIGSTDLTVYGSVNIGNTTQAGVLAVGHTDVTIEVRGAWTRGTFGGCSFINGGGTVSFNATGAYSITPQTTGNFSFGNVDFNGPTSTYNIVGGLTTTGDLTINDATFSPASGININIGGNYIDNGATFNTSVASTTILTKSGAQALTDAEFYNLTVSGSGTKTMSGNSSILNNLIINTGATLTAPTSNTLTIASNNAGSVTINGTGVFNDGDGSHYFNGPTWTAGASSYAGAGTITFNRNNAVTIAGGAFNNMLFTGAGNIAISAAVVATGDVNIALTAGNTITFNNNFSITGNGSGVFTLAANHTMNINGSTNFPGGFAAYVLSPTSTTNYTQAFAQTIAGITYGNLTLGSAATKTLAGNIEVVGVLTFGTSTLDVSSNNYSITVGGNYANGSSGSLLSNGGAHAGEVILNGTGAQTITNGATGSKSIYNLTINKTVATTATAATTNLTVLNNLTVSSGIFSLGGLTGTIGGNLQVTSVNGSIANSGNIVLNASSGTKTIQCGNATLPALQINAPGATYAAADNINFYGNFTLTAGTFDGNGYYIYLGNTAGRTINIASGTTYKIGPGGTMAFGPTASATIDGTIEAVGTSGSPVTITKNPQGSTYSFAVNGTIKAQYYTFEFMAATGIVVNGSATVDATNNFSDGTFTNGPNNCKYLTISNTQTFTVNNVAFPVTPTGAANNVVKASAGVVTFYNASGGFSGASYENDDGAAPTGAVRWTGPTTYTWIGAVSTNWYTAGNWSSSLGGNGVPDANSNVIIATNGFNRQPTIDGSGGAANTANLTINNTMILTVNTGAGVGDLVINGNLQIDGEIKTTSNNDFIECKGSFINGAGGTANLNFGTVTFNGTGAATLTNAGTFYNLVVNNAGANITLGSAIIVNGDITLTAGTLDVTTTYYGITVKGSWINNGGTFNARTNVGSTATVTFAATAAGPYTINAGSSSFNRITINAAASSTYTLAANMSTASNVTITNGILDLGVSTFNMGDNTGTDNLSITGTLRIGGGAFLRMGTGSSVIVNSAGTIKVVGTSTSDVATVTKQAGGTTYGFSVSSGGTIYAQYYLFEFMNTSGIVVSSGSTIDATDNFSNGTFSNGAAGGTYLSAVNNVTSYTITGITFNSGPLYAFTRTSGTGVITLSDPSGPLGSHLYEQDDGAAATGRLIWYFAATQLTWLGGTSTDWEDPLNWTSTGAPGPPTSATDVIIPSGTTYAPSLTANASSKALNIASGATLTQSTYTLNVNGSLSNSGTISSNGLVMVTVTTGSVVSFNAGSSSLKDVLFTGGGSVSTSSNLTTTASFSIAASTTFSVVTSATPTITVGTDWSNSGTFTPALSTVVLNKNSGTSSITSGVAGTTFYNLTISQPVTTTSKTVTATGSFSVTNAFAATGVKNNINFGSGNNIQLNTVTSSGNSLAGGSSTVSVRGNWTNNSVQQFIGGTSTVVLNGTGAQTISGSNSVNTFNNLTINNAVATVSVAPTTSVTVNGNLTLSTPFSIGTNTLSVKGNITNNSTYSGAGKIVLNGTLAQTITGSGSLANVELNNATGASLLSNHTINGALTLTSGKLFIDTYLLTLGASSSITGASAARFIYMNGSLADNGVRKMYTNGVGTSLNFTFPIGVGNDYRPAQYTGTGTTATGNITVKQINGKHPNTVVPANTELLTYWSVSSSGISAISLTHNYTYVNADVQGIEADYVTGRYFSGDFSSVGGAGNTVTPASNLIAFATANFIDGDYTAGYPSELGTPVVFYSRNATAGSAPATYSLTSTWSTDGGLTHAGASTTLTPTSSYYHSIVLAATHTVILDGTGTNSVSVVSVNIPATAVLDVANNQHNLGDVSGAGKIRIKDNGSGLFVLPAGTYTAFIAGGGSFEYYGAGNAVLPNTITTYNDLVFSESGDKTLPSNTNLTINGDFVIENTVGLQVIQPATNTLTVYGNFTNNLGTTAFTSDGTVIFAGTSAANTITGNTRFEDIIISNTYTVSPQVTLSGDVEVDGSITFSVGIVDATTHTLTINSGATTDDGNNVSFFDGPIIWKNLNGAGPYTFPTGDGERWARCAVSDITSPTDFVAQYIDAPYADVTTMAVPPSSTGQLVDLNNVSQKEHWDVGRGAVGVGNARVTLHWESGWYSRINSCADLKVSHWTGADWENVGGTVAPGSNCQMVVQGLAGPGSITSDVLSSFSPEAFGNVNPGVNPLPIELLSFEVTTVENDVNISWATATEINNDYFTIERSLDAVTFIDIKNIKSEATNGNSTTKIDYSTTDNNLASGKYYYRLKQTDFDGKFSYSSVEFAEINDSYSNNTYFNILPNPNNGKDFKIWFNSSISQIDESVTVEIVNMFGQTQLTYEYILKGQGVEIPVELNNILNSGVYMIKISTPKLGFKSQKMIIR
jgi:hypothetical protein